MASSTSNAKRTVAKVLGIKLDARDERDGVPLKSLKSNRDVYIEEDPTVLDWFASVKPTLRDVIDYFVNLFPFFQWIPKYNNQKFFGDLVAGITVGAVIVPQGMAYALLAQLRPQFGLYSSFMGALVYWIFGTSKDINIGPVAVLSTVTGNAVISAQKDFPDVHHHAVASVLAVAAGSIVALLGLLRLGWLVEFIPLPAIEAFITGSAITIASGQVQSLIGLRNTSAHGSAYDIIISIFKQLPGAAGREAAVGISALALLYLLRSFCRFAMIRYPKTSKVFFYLLTLRNVFVILLYTFISYLVNRNHKTQPRLRVLGHIPRGFQGVSIPDMNAPFLKAILKALPVTVVVLLIEHISVAKSFGRINNYTINPSQELIGNGAANLLGSFVGGYPVTGSFTRTAIQSKAGSKTQLTSLITAAVVLLAIYVLPAMFFFIPRATLSAVIIHAVGDLITPPNHIYRFWRISPLEVLIFFAGVFVAIFKSIEDGIYTTVFISLVVQLFRRIKPRGQFLGKVRMNSGRSDSLSRATSKGKERAGTERSIFLPLDRRDGSNPNIQLESPHPGVFVYRFSDGYNYLNASHYLDQLVEAIFRETQPATTSVSAPPLDRITSRVGVLDLVDSRPPLKAIVLDFSAVQYVDVTSIQNLIDVRNQLDSYAAPDIVEWHCACVYSRWTRRALAAADFGYDKSASTTKPQSSEKTIVGVTEQASSDSSLDISKPKAQVTMTEDVEVAETSVEPSRVVLHGVNRPFFHADVETALRVATQNAERQLPPPAITGK